MGSWKIYWNSNRNKRIIIFSFLTLFIVLFSFLHFLTYNEFRQGKIINDPLLNLFTPIDLSFYTFGTTYILALWGIFTAVQKPELFISLIQAYTLITILRMACMFFFPLEAPEGIIPLNDSFLQNTFYSGRDNLKDLFFSGHTATIFLFGLYFNDKLLKYIYFVGAAVIGLLLMIQRVHYSFDIFAAPFFTFIAYSVQKRIPS